MREHMVRLAAGCVFLWTAAVPDIRAQSIPVWIPVSFAAAATAADLYLPSCIERKELWAGALPGAVLLFLCLLLKGKLLTKRKKAGDRIAFIPFLAAAQTLILAAAVIRAIRP